MLREKQKAFTIVELLIVIVVIGILAALALVAYGGIQEKAAAATLKSDLKNAQTKLALMKVENSSFLSEADFEADESVLPKSGGTVYEYTMSGDNYCLTASSTRAKTSFYLDSADGSIKEGACEGHEGAGVVAAAQPASCPAGFIPVPGNSLFGTDGGFCIMKYEAKNVGNIATSQATGLPWVNMPQNSAVIYSQNSCDGCHLVTEAEWLTVAHNALNINSNWSGGVVGSGYIFSGHNDNNPAATLAASASDSDGYSGTGNSGASSQRRTLTLSNGEVIWDFAGNVWEFTSGQITGNQPGVTGAGGNWREWGDLSGNRGLNANVFPGYGTPAAGAWSSVEGIGKVYSNFDEPAVRAFGRGGGRGDNANAGVLSLAILLPPTSGGGTFGFRVAL